MSVTLGIGYKIHGQTMRVDDVFVEVLKVLGEGLINRESGEVV